MSGAILGYINKNQEVSCSICGNKMLQGLNKYKLDRISEIYHKNLFMACGLIYITKEDRYEVLPYQDESKAYIITVDAILDNREELINIFNLDISFHVNITDSFLILKAYEKWGEDCPKYLLGDFAFVIWDEKNMQLFCARDQVGKRSLYYYSDDNIFAFSTIINPLLKIASINELDKSWIVDFLYLEGPVAGIDGMNTIYKNIFKLLPAHILILKGNNEIIEKKYWNPLNMKKIKYKTSKEYIDKFKTIFNEAVNCRLRCEKDVAVMMSGGLDSTSVACVAANELKRNNKKIKAYSSIPFSSYKNNLSKWFVADERDYIKEVENYVDNLTVKYVDCENKNAFTNTDYYLNLLEEPYKIYQNIGWLDEIIEMSYKDECRVILDGQFGNSSISYGRYEIHIVTLFRNMKFIKLFKEIKAISKIYNKDFKTCARISAKMVLNDKTLKKLKYSYVCEREYEPVIPIKLYMIKKYKVLERLKEAGVYNCGVRYDVSEQRKKIINPVHFNQIGELETKQSLIHGVLRRDPTRDKRVIEFCMNIPEDIYVNRGRERLLIREAMKDVIPDKVRLNYDIRGSQSADWIQKIEADWPNILPKIEKFVDSYNLTEYISQDEMKKLLEKLKDKSLDENDELISSITTLYILNEFLEKNKKVKFA